MTFLVVLSATPLTETCVPRVIAQALPLVSVITGPTSVTIEQLGDIVGVGVGIGVRVGDGDGVEVAVGRGVGVGVGFGDGVDTGAGVAVGSGVGVEVGFGDGVDAGAGVAVGRGVGVGVGFGDGVDAGVGVAVGSGVGVGEPCVKRCLLCTVNCTVCSCSCELGDRALEVSVGVAAAIVIRCRPLATVVEFQGIVYGGPEAKYWSSMKTDSILMFGRALSWI
jgi:hypothetical protein